MMPPKPTLSQRLDAGGKNFVEQNCLPLQEAGISAFFPPTLSLSQKNGVCVGSSQKVLPLLAHHSYLFFEKTLHASSWCQLY